MLEPGDQDFIARLELRPRPGLRDKVDTFRGAANKNNLPAGGRIQKLLNASSCAFEGICGALTERVYAAMNVGMRRGLVVFDGIEHSAWPLRRGGAVEIHQRFTLHQGMQNWEVAPHAFNVKFRRRFDLCVHELLLSVARRKVAGSTASMAACSALDCRPVKASAINARFSRPVAVSRSRPRDNK